MAVIAIFASCEKNQSSPEYPTSKNQPADPAMWSPVGKIYICDRSDDNPYGYDYFMNVVYFVNDTDVAEYCTTNTDYSRIDKYYNTGTYSCNYPSVMITFGADKRPLYFIDTLTLRSDWWERTFTLAN